jgi:hypothetical protein
LLLASYLAYSLALKMETILVGFSESSVNFYKTTRCHIPEASTLHSDSHEALKSNPDSTFFSLGKKDKANPVTGRGCPEGCETSRLPHSLDNRLLDGAVRLSALRAGSPLPQEDS